MRAGKRLGFDNKNNPSLWHLIASHVPGVGTDAVTKCLPSTFTSMISKATMFYILSFHQHLSAILNAKVRKSVLEFCPWVGLLRYI